MCLILLTCSSLNVFANGTYDRNVDNICKVEKLKETISKEELRNILILSILVYTFFSRMFDLMLPPVAKHSIVVA